ncbi:MULTISPECIES: hypothetical protein [unclassified Sphingobium]|uniref:hypothetical protein n=1 Tax=unclassified Sphingobium TaxID=2611147 RepID=UPI0035A62923
MSAEILPVSEGEWRRYLEGRHDWQDDEWQDHCGMADCPYCDGLIPDRNERLARERAEALLAQSSTLGEAR